MNGLRVMKLNDYSNLQVAVVFLVLGLVTGFTVYMLLFYAEFCGQDYSTLSSRCESLWYWINS